jgi:glycosyltransferase involved in cell wall biosynthesis
MNPTVSVILPFYRNEQTLAGSVESILNQTFEDFELVLIDNNSPDPCYAIASDLAEKDSRIKIISESRQGIVYALNKGLEHAKGMYIARMDADDTALPQRLEKQVSHLNENPDVGLIASLVNYIGDEELQYGFFEYVKWNNRLITYEDISLNRFVESPLVHPSVMFRRELTEKFGPYRHGDFPEDYELWLRFLHGGVNMSKLPEPLLDWRDSPERLTRNDERYSTLSFFETKTVYLYEWLKENNPFFPEIVVWGAGRRSRERFSLLHDLGVHPKFFIDLRANPGKRVIEYKHTPPAGKHFILSYVANREAREQIKSFLVELGYTEGKDFICIA